MLKIIVEPKEGFDHKTQRFITTPGAELCLEHSLVSISKWEAKWHKAFLTDDEKTEEELLDYIKCMTLTQNVNDNVYLSLINDKVNMDKINNYIADSRTATTFTDRRSDLQTGHKKDRVTSELIYFWMSAYQIPFVCEKWHLNRLLVLIKIAEIKNNTNNKMSTRETMAHNRALNAARRRKFNSKG